MSLIPAPQFQFQFQFQLSLIPASTAPSDRPGNKGPLANTITTLWIQSCLENIPPRGHALDYFPGLNYDYSYLNGNKLLLGCLSILQLGCDIGYLGLQFVHLASNLVSVSRQPEAIMKPHSLFAGKILTP